MTKKIKWDMWESVPFATKTQAMIARTKVKAPTTKILTKKYPGNIIHYYFKIYKEMIK